MKWDKDPERAFPARHPREPGGLRQEILDEIADHLACAAERERELQEEENEEAVWDRVLERFGDPDAIARTLWWDQMRETVMREWIQTGVMIVVTIAVLAGLAMMTRLVAGVGTANDAMRDAMKQVAASNESLAKAMAEQRAGNEAMLKALSGIRGGGGEEADALELSNIEIVVRRGTPEGPPAPEVKVGLIGKGPNDEVLSVNASLDDSGRAVFERLYQGAYQISFFDPASQLSAATTITLFAGKGVGEHVIVAPDVEPRLVNVDFDLPLYGDDEAVLISARLQGNWEYGGLTWTNYLFVLVGKTSTRLFSLEPCLLAGKVLPVTAALATRNDTGDWQSDRNVVEGVEWVSELEDSTGLDLKGKLPEDITSRYGEAARRLLSMKHLKGEENAEWISAAAAGLTDSILIKVGFLPEPRAGEWHDGHMYALVPGRRTFGTITSGHAALGAPNKLALALPEEFIVAPPEGKNLFLGLAISQYEKNEIPSDGRAVGTRMNTVEDVFGNRLAAYALHGDWQSTEWPAWNPDAPEVVGTVLSVDEKPFWEVSSEALKGMIGTGKLFIPISSEIFSNADQPVTGVLLCWEDSAENYWWGIKVDLDGNATASKPCWMVTEPIAAVAAEPAVKP